MSEVFFVCEKCPKRYKSRFHFEQHKLIYEGNAAVANPEQHKCPYCSKTYKTARNFEKHKLTHLQTGADASLLPKAVEADTNTAVCDIDDAELWPEPAVIDQAFNNYEDVFEEEDEEQERLMLSSMLGMNLDPPVPDKVSSRKKNDPKTPIALCSACVKGYMTLDGFIKHRMSHAMADAVAKAPSLQQFKEEAQRCVKGVLEGILQSYPNPIGKIEEQLCKWATKMLHEVDSPKVSDFLSSLCDGLFASFAGGDKFLLPSQLREAYLQGAAVLMANKGKREELKTILTNALQMDNNESDLDFFLSSFMRHMSNKLLAFIAHWLAHGKDSPIVMSSSMYIDTKQSLESTEFKQTLHYTAGANVKSMLRCAWRKWGSNEECKAIIKTLRGNFLIGGPQEAVDCEFMAWTLCQDRGKLIKVNDQSLSFFLELAAVVKPLEHLDGSLYVEEVIEKFASYPKIIYLWEELVKDTLPKQLSFRLLHSLVTCFCNTWRSGIISRRMDELQISKSADVLGTSGVSFRPKVVKYNKQ